MPTLCMKAYTIVVPTNVNPRRLRSFESASDSGVLDGSVSRVSPGRRSTSPLTNYHT